MKRINGCSHLYRRGHTFVFRRAVPPDARAAFGGRREIQKSLGAISLAEARHLVADQQRLFEQTLAEARGVIAPIDKIHRQVAVPTAQDMEMAVRRWLSSRVERERKAIAAKTPDQEDDYLADLRLQQLHWDSVARRGPISPSVSTQWIAESLADEHGWELQPQSSAHRSLLRLISRAQFEAAERIRQELEGEAVKAVDERFSPEQYQADATSPTKHPVKPVSLKGLRVRLYANPTRAIANFLASTREVPIDLADIPYDQILGFNQNAGPLDLNGDTNWIESMARARSLFGDDALAGFVPWFESALKAFCIEMVAPSSAGFEVLENEERLVACNGVHRVALNWSRLTLWRAEVYFDRQYSGTLALMNRCLARVTSGQSEGRWTALEPPHGAARTEYGAIVGARLTNSIEQILYAKTRNLIRCEFRYRNRIRNALGDPDLNSLTEWILAIRNNALRRLRWPSVLRLIEPVRGVDMQHLVEFLGRLSRAVGDDAQGDLAIRTLLTTGGLDSSIPRRLLVRLRDAEIIEDARFQSRTLRGQRRRYGLTPRYCSAT